MRVLVACEYSGRVRDAFRRKGHDAISCDLLPSESSKGPHRQGSVLPMLTQRWDLVIAFPPCTDLASSNGTKLALKERDGRTDAAAEFFYACYNANAARVAVENPVGVMSWRLRPPDQIVNPWEFGDPFKKRTCLWLRGLPTLKATHLYGDYSPAPSPWCSGSGVTVNKVRNFKSERPVARKAKDRSITFQGLANAMADQWG
jgi:hypothetical protein